MSLPRAILPVLALLACGAPKSGGDPEEAFLAGCDRPRTCGDVQLQCFDIGPGCGDPFTADTRCVLETLADARPLALHFDFSGQLSGEVEYFDIVVSESGDAIVGRSFEDPGTFEVSTDARACKLAAPALFTACLAAADDDPMHASCMWPETWFTDCVAIDAVKCP